MVGDPAGADPRATPRDIRGNRGPDAGIRLRPRAITEGASMADNQVVLGIFADEAAADAAVESLKAWDKATDEIKLGAIGVLVVDEDGQIKEHKLGSAQRQEGRRHRPRPGRRRAADAARRRRRRRPPRSLPSQGPGSQRRGPRAHRRASSPAARRPSASWRRATRPARSSASSPSSAARSSLTTCPTRRSQPLRMLRRQRPRQHRSPPPDRTHASTRPGFAGCEPGSSAFWATSCRRPRGRARRG